MRLRHLGTESNQTGCPALYATDRGTYVVQGWRVEDPHALADIVGVGEEHALVEIPPGLLRHAGDGAAPRSPEVTLPGSPAIFPTRRGTFLVRGALVADAQAIQDLIDVRSNEFYVEVTPDVLDGCDSTPLHGEEP